MLTDLKIKAAKPPARGMAKLYDAGGLFLAVTAAGAKLWRMRFKRAGKEQLISLGPYPEVTLARARGLRDEAQAALRAGAMPCSRNRSLADAETPDSGPSFEEMARRWHASQKARWKPHHADDVLGSLATDVFPKLGAIPISAVKSPQILEVVRAIESRSVDIARRVRQRISAVFCYAIAEGVAEADPAAPIVRAMAVHVKGQRPAITELNPARAMLRLVEATPSHPITKLAHRLLALTAVRPGELRLAAWSEFEGLDEAMPLWRIPGLRMKMQRPHLVPLAPPAVEVLRLAHEISGDTPLVFPSSRNSRKAISENAMGYLLNRAGFRDQHVPHGWRSTFSSVMNEHNPADRAVIDLMLAHAPSDRVEAAYNRALHMDRRRAIAGEWADLILEGASPASELLGGARR